MSEGNKSQSISPSKTTWHGPPPPIELTTNASSFELLSQGAEARVWLVTLPDPSKSNQNNENTNSSSGGGGGGGHRMRTIHVGSGINVPQLLTLSQQPSPLIPQTTPAIMDKSSSPSSSSSSSTSTLLKIICKERFPKKYRHPALDASLTKSRTKGEARSLIRCQRANVPCTNVLAIAHLSCLSSSSSDDNGSGMTNNGNPRGKSESNSSINNNSTTYVTSTTSSCLFLEYVEGCTVRQYFERRSGEQHTTDASTTVKTTSVDDNAGGAGEQPAIKRPRCETSASTTSTTTAAANTNTESKDEFRPQDRVTTVIDSRTLLVAHTIGTLVAQMHNAGVIHGDLTTSNIMIRNPPWLCDGAGGGTDTGNNATETLSSWKPQLVLIDFGLATSTASSKTSNNNASSSSSGNKKSKPHKQQHNAEEKAVDLYVLERAFLSTHPESEPLVEEVWKGYRSCFENLNDCQNDADGVAGDGMAGGGSAGQGGEENDRGYLAKSVLNRLEQVRMRGRKRECFG